MFNKFQQNENIISEFQVKRFYCFKCSLYYIQKIPSSLSMKLIQKNGYYNCKFCKENFIAESNQQTKDIVQNLQIPKYHQPQNEEIRQQINTDITIKKKIQLQMNNTYVKDVLMEVFPTAFRRASIERIQAIRSLLNALSSMEQIDEFGPSDPEFIKKLNVQQWSKQKFIKYESCPICTDLFKEDDQVIQLKCQHLFHDQCLKPWIKKKNSCPNCRIVLPRKQLIFKSLYKVNHYKDYQNLNNIFLKKFLLIELKFNNYIYQKDKQKKLNKLLIYKVTLDYKLSFKQYHQDLNDQTQSHLYLYLHLSQDLY